MTKKNAPPTPSAQGIEAERRAVRRAPIAAAVAVVVAVATAIATALALSALSTAQAAAAGGWIAGRPDGSQAASRSAGFAVGGVFGGIWFSCEGVGPGTLRLLVARPGWRFDDAARRTVVVSVDGTAFLFSALPEPRPGGGAMLASAAPRAAFAPLVAALARGKSTEISTPLGRYTLALGGSGKALAALQAGCGG